MLKARIFFEGLCLTLLFSSLSLPATPVLAQSLEVAEGVVGSTITISDLTASTSYRILWDSSSYKNGTVSSSGIVTFTVPETYGGYHTVQVQNPSGTQVLSSSFTVLPSISISLTGGAVEESTTVSGTGFGESESSIKILYDDSSIETGIEADSNGSWSESFIVPDSYTGTHTIDASGSETDESDVDDVYFTVEPAITISPTSGAVGSTVTVKGTGFYEDETSIKVTFDDTKIKTGITAGDDGSWNITFTVPGTYSGSHTIDASGSSTDEDDIDDVTFDVQSGISLDKTSVYVGDAVAVTGTGFGEDETDIYVTLDGINQGSSISADATGQWKTSLSIPATTNGTHTIDAHGSITSASSIVDKQLTVLAKIVLSPTGGNVGDTVTISGTGFIGGKTIVVSFGTVSVLSNISSDSEGSFTRTFEAPKGAGGDINVVATDANNTSATSVFAMDRTAPSVPQIESPAIGGTVGFTGSAKVNFKWADVTDPSGISYDIQVATDSAFSDIVFEHSVLTAALYDSTNAEALPKGQYYWRVRAVDGANNASDWTAATQFKSGLISVTMLIILIVIVIGVIIFLRARAVFSKR